MLFAVPLIVFLLFSMIEMSMYFNTRAQVESANRDGVRMAANWGGTTSGIRLNPTGKDVAAIIQESLGPNATSSCTVKALPGLAGGTYARRAGQPVTCTTTYDYQPVAAGIYMFGLEGIIDKDIVASENAYAEVGYSQ